MPDGETPLQGFEVFADCHCEVGEGPLWSEAEQRLYWIDVSRGDVFRKAVGGNAEAFERFRLSIGKIGGMVFAADRFCLLFADRGRVWQWEPGGEPTLVAELRQAENTRFNEAIADPTGRVFCGVAPASKGESGSLWLMDRSGGFSCIEPEIPGMPNGMGFSPDRRHFYFTSTHERIIYRYDYDPESGALAHRYPLVTIPAEEGFPDGMAVDSEGCLWSAQWGGSRVVRYADSGERLLELGLPAKEIASAAFGGVGLRSLFVTTANHPWSKDDDERVRAGAVFVMEQTIPGLRPLRAQMSRRR